MGIKSLAIATALAFSGAAFSDDSDFNLTGIPSGSEATLSPWNRHLVGINALNAWAAYPTGTFGKGVVVGVIDSGINYSHTEFTGRILSGYNAITNKAGATVASDTLGHGTHVSGIIGAAANGTGMAGVANEAYILPVKVFGGSGSTTSSILDAGIKWAAPRASILSMSLGGSAPLVQSTIQNAVATNGVLIVAAAGNSAGANPDWPARFAKESWANGQIIAVGSVNPDNNQISSFSNRAGDTKNFYLVAPGESIASTYIGKNDPYALMSGTSMATPVVSGAAAVIWGYWKYLKANQVANILFHTATDLGDPGVDATYGWGLVNLKQALEPSNPTIYGSSGTTTTLSGSTITSSSITTAGIRKASFNAVDEFGRTFSYQLASFDTRRKVSTVDTLFDGMDKSFGLVERSQGQTRFQVQAYRVPLATHHLGNPMAEETVPVLNGFNYVRSFNCVADDCRQELAFGANGFADKYFGLAAHADLPVMSLSNPYFSLAGQNSGHVGLGFDLGTGYKAKIGLLTRNPTQGQQGIYMNPKTGSGWIAELAHTGEDSNVFFSLGSVTEHTGTALGFAGTGGMSLDSAGTSNYVTVAAIHKLSPKSYLLGSVSLGNTRGVSGSGAIEGISGATTQSWSLGIARTDAWREGDRLAFIISQPLHATSGSLTVASPNFDLDGNMYFVRQNYSLRPETTETRFEVGYSSPVAKQGKVQFNAMQRHGVDGLAGQKESAVGMRYLVAF